MTRDIVGDIRAKLTPQEQVRIGRARPVNPEAYDHYLRGLFYLSRQNREGNEAAAYSGPLPTAVLNHVRAFDSSRS